MSRPVICNHCGAQQSEEEQTGIVENDWESLELNGIYGTIYDLCGECSKGLWVLLNPKQGAEGKTA